jgi:hypothetical protein
VTAPDPTAAPARTRMSADIDAPDKVVYGLTFRQLAILAAAAAGCYAAYQALHRYLPLPVLLGAGVVAGGVVFGLAVGRRDGLPFDVWLAHAVRHARAPKTLSTSDASGEVPDWVDRSVARMALPAPLRLPADAIDDDGVISLDGATAAVVAAGTVNLALRTPAEQAALVEAYGRWLNSLSAPAQIVVCAQPVDLHRQSRALAARSEDLPHPALRAACADHAAFLADLAERRDPLRRQVLVVCRTAPGETGRAAHRRADDAVRALAGLGVATGILDGAAVTAALAAAADPYRPPRPGGLAAAGTVITGPPASHPDTPQRTKR